MPLSSRKGLDEIELHAQEVDGNRLLQASITKANKGVLHLPANSLELLVMFQNYYSLCAMLFGPECTLPKAAKNWLDHIWNTK